MTFTVEILDIRRLKSSTETSLPHLRSSIINGLSNPTGNRTTCSEVLYDTVGLAMYSDSVKNNWPGAGYYLYEAEMNILGNHAMEVAAEFGGDNDGRVTVIIELGARSLEKTSRILLAIAETVPPADIPPITYYALDIDHPSILESIVALHSQIGPKIHNRIRTKGMWGTYDDAFYLLNNSAECLSTLGISPEVPVHVMFLGEKIANFTKLSEDVGF